MIIRTKIVATVGPACQDQPVLAEMVRAGVDVFRINFSHGDESTRAAALEAIRGVEAESGQPLAVMADLCGPKIRVGMMAGGGSQLATGGRVEIRRDPVAGDADVISTTLGELVDNVHLGQTLLLDEGGIRLRVAEAHPPERIVCQIVRGGLLGSGKGVHLPETELKLSALTEKDRADVAWIVQRDFDLVALSFVQRPADVRELRSLLPEQMWIIAKIERPQALERIDGIVEVADGLMVARGDLGVEMPLPQVPLAQKRLVGLCRRRGRACIVATQMLESMTRSPLPTRAEVSDIANAVLDGSDAVMLSGETAVGAYPVQAVAMMNEIAAAAEVYEAEHPSDVRVECAPSPTTAALAAAVRAVIDREPIAAVAVFTATGTTAGMLAKQRLAVPILAMSPSLRAVRQMNLLYGVRPVREAAPGHTREVLAMAGGHLKAMGLAKPGEKVAVVSGRPIGKPGATNTLVIHTLG